MLFFHVCHYFKHFVIWYHRVSCRNFKFLQDCQWKNSVMQSSHAFIGKITQHDIGEWLVLLCGFCQRIPKCGVDIHKIYRLFTAAAQPPSIQSASFEIVGKSGILFYYHPGTSGEASSGLNVFFVSFQNDSLVSELQPAAVAVEICRQAPLSELQPIFSQPLNNSTNIPFNACFAEYRVLKRTVPARNRDW